MSRSFRKPVFKASYGSESTKFWKRIANKKVRKQAQVPDGSAYRKVFDSWTICDYRWWLAKPHWLNDKSPRWKSIRK